MMFKNKRLLGLGFTVVCLLLLVISLRPAGLELTAAAAEEANEEPLETATTPPPTAATNTTLGPQPISKSSKRTRGRPTTGSATVSTTTPATTLTPAAPAPAPAATTPPAAASPATSTTPTPEPATTATTPPAPATSTASPESSPPAPAASAPPPPPAPTTSAPAAAVPVPTAPAATEAEIKAAEEAKKAKEAAAKKEEAERLAAEAELKRQAEAEKKRQEERDRIRAALEEMKIYDLDVEPLTLKDCIRCHISQTSRLKEKGGKHRFVACTDCHREYHAYNPPQENFIDIMPKCSFCHEFPHGPNKQVASCPNCHSDPHQPRTVPHPEKFEEQCRICHPAIRALLDGAPSKHTEQKCSACHSEVHGRKPNCSECHKNHSPDIAMETGDCLKCHPVHTPLKIDYPLTQSKELCGGCHQKPYEDLKTNKTKHSELTCAKCHPQHGHLMQCQECHGEKVHDSAMHQGRPNCGDCHSIAHNLEK